MTFTPALPELPALPPLIDTCVNLTHDSFDADRREILARAKKAGVTACILTGACEETSRASVALCGEYADEFPNMLYATAGVHPHLAKGFTTETAAALLQIAREKPVVAIGEAGLDFHRNFSSPQDQEKAFTAQLELAVELKMPIFMHEREAHQRHYEILKDYRDMLVDGVIHCFTGTREALFRYLDMDLHIGITGWICDERRGTELQELVHNIPLERLMLETDAPYLLPRNISPKPKTRRNEPARLPWVLEMVAQHREENAETIALSTTDTARRFFRLEQT